MPTYNVRIGSETITVEARNPREATRKARMIKELTEDIKAGRYTLPRRSRYYRVVQERLKKEAEKEIEKPKVEVPSKQKLKTIQEGVIYTTPELKDVEVPREKILIAQASGKPVLIGKKVIGGKEWDIYLEIDREGVAKLKKVPPFHVIRGKKPVSEVSKASVTPLSEAKPKLSKEEILGPAGAWLFAPAEKVLEEKFAPLLFPRSEISEEELKEHLVKTLRKEYPEAFKVPSELYLEPEVKPTLEERAKVFQEVFVKELFRSPPHAFYTAWSVASQYEKAPFYQQGIEILQPSEIRKLGEAYLKTKKEIQAAKEQIIAEYGAARALALKRGDIKSEQRLRREEYKALKELNKIWENYVKSLGKVSQEAVQHEIQNIAAKSTQLLLITAPTGAALGKAGLLEASRTFSSIVGGMVAGQVTEEELKKRGVPEPLAFAVSLPVSMGVGYGAYRMLGRSFEIISPRPLHEFEVKALTSSRERALLYEGRYPEVKVVGKGKVMGKVKVRSKLYGGLEDYFKTDKLYYKKLAKQLTEGELGIRTEFAGRIRTKRLGELWTRGLETRLSQEAVKQSRIYRDIVTKQSEDLIMHAKTLRSAVKIGEEGVVGKFPFKKIYLTEEFTLGKGEVMPRRAGISFRARGISRVIEALRKQKPIEVIPRDVRRWGFRGLGLRKQLDLFKRKRVGIGLREFAKRPKPPKVEVPVKVKEIGVKGVGKAVVGEIGYEIGIANLRALESMMARNIAFFSALGRVPRAPPVPRITLPRLELRELGAVRAKGLEDLIKITRLQIPIPKPKETLDLKKVISMPKFRFEFPKYAITEPKISEVKPIVRETPTIPSFEISTPIVAPPPPPEIIIPPGITGLPGGELPPGFGKARFRYPKWWYYKLIVHPLAPLEKVLKRMAKGMGLK